MVVYIIKMSLNNRKIDEIGYVIIEPLIHVDMENKNADVRKYNRLYHREYYRKFLCVKVCCELCGCSVTKEKLKIHQQSNKCHRLRTTYKNKIETTSDKTD